MTQNPETRELATGLEFPEGPVVMEDGSVLVVEIHRATLSRVPAGGGTAEIVADLGGGPNGAAIGPDGAAYVVNNGGFVWSDFNGAMIPFDLTTMSNEPPDFQGGWVDRVDLGTGAHTTIYRECDGLTFQGPNDIVFDTAGGFWFTDFGKTRPRTADRGSLFYATPDGSHIVQAARGLTGPNGVGLSPAGDRVYVAESYTGRLLAWDVTAPGVLASPAPTVVEATKGHFDSLAVEADGDIVVAAIGAGLCVVAADGSGHSYVPISEPMTTNVAFGGPGQRTAFVTLSASGRLVEMDWPRAGLALSFSA